MFSFALAIDLAVATSPDRVESVASRVVTAFETMVEVELWDDELLGVPVEENVSVVT